MAKGRRTSVQKYHDRVAGRYDQTYDDAFWQWHDELTWAYIKPFIPRDQRAGIVDLGCGTGKWGAKLAKSGYAVTFVDVSHQMIDRARAKVMSGQPTARATFVQADLCDLSALEAGPFGFALAMGDPIGCARSPAKALVQIGRILSSGAVLIATFDNRLAGIDHYLASGNADVLTRFLRDGKTHWLTQDAEEQFEIHTYTPHELLRLVEAAGFEVLDLVGKTVLPMRFHRSLLADSRMRRKWAKIERSLCRDTAAMGRASHLQIACRWPIAASNAKSSHRS